MAGVRYKLNTQPEVRTGEPTVFERNVGTSLVSMPWHQAHPHGTAQHRPCPAPAALKTTSASMDPIIVVQRVARTRTTDTDADIMIKAPGRSEHGMAQHRAFMKGVAWPISLCARNSPSNRKCQKQNPNSGGAAGCTSEDHRRHRRRQRGQTQKG